MKRLLVLLTAVVACGGDNGGGGGPNYGDQHPRIKITTNADGMKAAFDAKAPEAMTFLATTDKWVGGADVYLFAPWNAALVGQLTGDAKYCTAAIAAVDKLVKAEQAKIDGGSNPTVADDDYYAIGDNVGNIALVYDWCYDAIASDRRQAWLGYAQQAVFNVWHPDGAMWGGKAAPWTGWAVDDPENNYYYNFLRATMLLGLAAHGEFDGVDQWLTWFHDTKVVGEMNPQFDGDVVGGGSREGTGYGVALMGLWELYDIWQASTGENLATMSPHTRASLLFFLHEMVPTLDRVSPTGDQSRDSTASFFDYHRHYVESLITLFPNDALAPKAKAMLANSSLPAMSQQFMQYADFVNSNSIAATTEDTMGTDFYGPGTGQLFMRSGWDKHATWINMNAGPYTQSHAHQDQGAIMIYKDGWLAYDPVIDSHSGLPQDIDDHGTLRILNSSSKATAQKMDTAATMLALHKGDGYVHAATDLAPVYGSAVTQFQREVIYLEPDTVVIFDRTASSGSQVWSLAFPKQPTINGATTTVMNAGHTLTVQRLGEASATSSVFSYNTDSDFSSGYRLDETVAGGSHQWLHVAYVDSAVTSVTATDATSADITLAGGKLVHVSFNPSTVGATLKIGNATTTLGAGVDSLPE
jgi:hypothetical protein